MSPLAPTRRFQTVVQLRNTSSLQLPKFEPVYQCSPVPSSYKSQDGTDSFRNIDSVQPRLFKSFDDTRNKVPTDSFKSKTRPVSFPTSSNVQTKRDFFERGCSGDRGLETQRRSYSTDTQPFSRDFSMDDKYMVSNLTFTLHSDTVSKETVLHQSQNAFPNRKLSADLAVKHEPVRPMPYRVRSQTTDIASLVTLPVTSQQTTGERSLLQKNEKHSVMAGKPENVPFQSTFPGFPSPMRKGYIPAGVGPHTSRSGIYGMQSSCSLVNTRSSGGMQEPGMDFTAPSRSPNLPPRYSPCLTRKWCQPNQELGTRFDDTDSKKPIGLFRSKTVSPQMPRKTFPTPSFIMKPNYQSSFPVSSVHIGSYAMNPTLPSTFSGISNNHASYGSQSYSGSKLSTVRAPSSFRTPSSYQILPANAISSQPSFRTVTSLELSSNFSENKNFQQMERNASQDRSKNVNYGKGITRDENTEKYFRL